MNEGEKKDGQKKPLAKRMEEKRDNVARGLMKGDRETWHKILMSVAIVFVGLLVLCGIFIDFMLGNQREKGSEVALHIPAVDIEENARLTKGHYLVYKAFVDDKGITHYLVSRSAGGVVVAAVPPQGSDEPNDAFDFIVRDPASYTITVTQDGLWHFVPSAMYGETKAAIERERDTGPPANAGQGSGQDPMLGTGR